PARLPRPARFGPGSVLGVLQRRRQTPRPHIGRGEIASHSDINQKGGINTMWLSKKCKRGTQVLLLACVAGLVAMALAGSALATPASNSQQVSVASGTADLGGFTLQAPVELVSAGIPVVLTDLTVSATANWTGNITTDVGWESDKVRQGDDLA